MSKVIIDSSNIYRLLEILNGSDYETRLIGGCVRDMVLGRVPADIDLATTLVPEEVMRRLKKHNIYVKPTGLAHGTVMAIMDKKPYEITTLRQDVACDGRHAEVEFTSDWKLDAARRDFTINAMSCDAEGNVYDYYDGQADIQQGCVRFIGNPAARIAEDGLRILRFFRFSAYYAADALHEPSLHACIEHKQMLQQLSAERIATEMMKLLAAPDPQYVIEAMVKHGILAEVFFDIPHAACLQHYLSVEKKSGINILPVARLSALMVELDKPVSESVDWLRQAWKISNKQAALLQYILEAVYALAQPCSQAKQKKLLRYVGKTVMQDVVYVAMAYKPEYQTVYVSMLALIKSWDIPIFPIKGQHIINAGLAEGKRVGELLVEAELWWEEQGYSPQKQDIIDWLREKSL